MQKLKKVISLLDDTSYDALCRQFQKTKANNFLFLLQKYKQNEHSDNSIMEELNLSSNSYYVLKSRLYDKVQENLNSEVDVSKDDVMKQFQQLFDLCFSMPREVSNAKLEKLEKDLLSFELHNELIILYSVLKRTHLYSEKYFHYSQLYNKHIAFALSTEKAIDILGTFNRKLNQYLFSRSENFLNEVVFLHKEIDDYYNLNPNKQIEIVKNFIEIQVNLFCGLLKDKNVSDLLKSSEGIINSAPNSSIFKKWELSLNYLYFEYYIQINQLNLAEEKFVLLEENIEKLLLSNPICIVSNYLTSRIKYLYNSNQESKLLKKTPTIIYDPYDSFSNINSKLHLACCSFLNGNYKEAITLLNSILNENSFKDFIHINIEVKLILVYFYILLKEFDLAENLLKNLLRKIKSDHGNSYSNVTNLSKFLNLAITSGGFKKISNKQLDYLTLFEARNMGEFRLIDYFLPIINKSLN